MSLVYFPPCGINVAFQSCSSLSFPFFCATECFTRHRVFCWTLRSVRARMVTLAKHQTVIKTHFLQITLGFPLSHLKHGKARCYRGFFELLWFFLLPDNCSSHPLVVTLTPYPIPQALDSRNTSRHTLSPMAKPLLTVSNFSLLEPNSRVAAAWTWMWKGALSPSSTNPQWIRGKSIILPGPGMGEDWMTPKCPFSSEKSGMSSRE